MIIELNIKPLSLKYDDAVFLLYKDDSAVRPSIRRLEELYEVAYEKDFIKTGNGNKPVYYMYRDIHREEDKPLLETHKIRYDITIIPPFLLGDEYIKTAGHYHPIAEDKITFPETYEIIEGEAHILLQKPTMNKITDVAVINARRKDKIIIPPNYGHVTINPSEQTLIMANIVSSKFKSIYEPMKRMGGGAYFELAKNKFIKNTLYSETPEIRFLRAKDVSCLPSRKGLYELFLENNSYFEFLNTPSKYQKLFSQYFNHDRPAKG